ncbi:MAG TPA: T9SS type A sorting domain-containing protein [Bacteroidales bacterium]|nr:T9SS type A sorting domain-containing protein [Bacteroidales bacterium]HSA44585.1 T9SS type A sorting domain-containing protein [Bacteroidales bacterium]
MTLKRNFLLQLIMIVLTVVPFISVSQNLSWQWARGAGGGEDDVARAVVADDMGNLYVAGYFSSPLISFDTVNLSNAGSGSSDVFIAKYDAYGNVLWAKRAGGSGDDYALSACLTDSWGIYVAGTFKSSSITFDSYTLTNSNPPNEALFVVKYDVAGSIVWAKTAANSPDNDAANSVTVDPLGNIFITGYFQSTAITFGANTLYNAAYPGQDIFVVKFDPDANVLWARSAGGTHNDIGNAVTVDATGDVLIGGEFMSEYFTIGAFTLNNFGCSKADAFVAKYDGQGNVIWVTAAGGSDHDRVLSVSTDNTGNFYAAGYFKSSSIVLGPTTLVNEGPPYGDFFLVKFNTEGSVFWAVKSVGSQSSDGINSVVYDNGGGLYVTGHFQSQHIVFGPDVLSNASSPGMETFIARFDASTGNAMWGLAIPGPGNDAGNAVLPAMPGCVYIGGQFTSTSLTFGSTMLTNAAASKNDLFIARLDGNVGIPAFTGGETLFIYPNPFCSEALLSIGKDLNDAEVTLVNCCGQFVRHITHSAGDAFVLSRAGLANGLYFVKLVTGGRVIAARKVIVTD